MRKVLFFSLLFLATGTFASCQTAKTMNSKDIPVDIIFNKWHIQFGQLKSMDITLKGKNKSGATVELPTMIQINQYDEFLLPMLVKLEEEGQFKDGNTGSGSIKLNPEGGRSTLVVKKVGKLAAKDMNFLLDAEQLAAFLK